MIWGQVSMSKESKECQKVSECVCVCLRSDRCAVQCNCLKKTDNVNVCCEGCNGQQAIAVQFEFRIRIRYAFWPKTPFAASVVLAIVRNVLIDLVILRTIVFPKPFPILDAKQFNFNSFLIKYADAI